MARPRNITPISEGGPFVGRPGTADAFPRDRAWVLVRRVPAYARLAWALSRDPALPRSRRIALIGAMAYLVSPVDVVPGLIPLLGQVDDVLVVLVALRFALSGLPAERRREHLAGAGLDEADIAEDLDAISDMGAWLVRTGGRAGGRASRMALGTGARWAAEAGRRGAGWLRQRR